MDLGFILKALVLGLYIALDFRDVLLCLEESIFPEVFQELSILSIDPLLLPFQVLLALLDDLAMGRQEHLVPILFIFNLLLLEHPRVLEVQQHLLGLRQLLQAVVLVLLVCLVLLL